MREKEQVLEREKTVDEMTLLASVTCNKERIVIKIEGERL